jgi:hypothetical protein
MHRTHRTPMFTVVSILAVALGVTIGPNTFANTAQDATPADTANHPIVGTWIVDTVSATDTDSPEVGIFHADGTMVGLGANRSAGGTWEVIDDSSVSLTLITVADSNGVGTYVVVRGTHVLDDSGNGWTCDDCAFTVVGADGTVLDSGSAPASAVRMPVQGPEEVGNPLTEVPVWMPAPPMEATPAS